MEGLWLASTVCNTLAERFHVVAWAMGRRWTSVYGCQGHVANPGQVQGLAGRERAR